MVSVSNISFRASSSNLLQNALVQKKSETVQPKITQIQPNLDLQANSDLQTKPSFNGRKYVAPTVALVSLGVSTILAAKLHKGNKSLKQVKSELDKLSKEFNSDSQGIKDDLASKVADLKQGIKQGLNKAERQVANVRDEVGHKIQQTEEKITDLGKWQDGQIDGLRKETDSKISQLTSVKSTGSSGEVLYAPTVINDEVLELATTMHGYGKNTEALENSLRQEATKRIFGIIDRSKMVPKDSITIRIPTSEFKGFSNTGGMSVVPKEVTANLGAVINGKQNARLIVDTPMYLGQVENEVYYSLVKREDGLFDYISHSNKGEKKLANGIKQIDTMTLPIYTDNGKIQETVDVLLAKDLEQAVDLELLKQWLDKRTAKKLEELINSKQNFEIIKGPLKVKYSPDKGDVEPIASVRYDTVFYKNNKFRLNGPEVKEKNKDIYNNLTHEAGETERFIYFDKFFYEHLLNNAESSTDKLGADLIIGNDWQTGGISAMMRLLTTAKRYFGLEPQVADKIYNTPIITLIHNAGLDGHVWHSQSKLLNIMFGEHASMITKNAWMPKNTSLKKNSLNGLFHGHDFNPQTMAAVYSDTLIPVSKGYGHEMASHSGFGCVNHDIFRMRARYHEFSDIGNVKRIARENGLDETLVPKKNMGYRPITNGSDKLNNVLTYDTIETLEHTFGLPPGSIKLKSPTENVLSWHLNNKEVYLNNIVNEINMARIGKGNPMKIALPELTDLTGVTKDTMIVSTAGRIVDQKGLDIFAEAIDEFLSRHAGQSDMPVFYVQGRGDLAFIDRLMKVKRSVAEKYGKQAANRIVFAEVFNETGRYDGCKLMSDFTVMSSWFEPCGLVHKQIATFNGAIPIVNKVGGLTDGLKDGVDAIFSEFRPKFDNYDDALNFNRHAFADALDKAFELFKDKEKLAKVMENSYNGDYSWLKKNGPMQEYVKALIDLKVLKPSIGIHN